MDGMFLLGILFIAIGITCAVTALKEIKNFSEAIEEGVEVLEKFLIFEITLVSLIMITEGIIILV